MTYPVATEVRVAIKFGTIDTLYADTLTFEARFRNGHLFFDRTGATIIEILKLLPCYVQKVSPEAVTLVFPQSEVIATFNHQKLVVSRAERGQWLAPEVASLMKSAIARHADELYNLLVDRLSIEATTRIGARFSFIAKAEKAEDSDKFLKNVSQHSEHHKTLEDLTRSTLFNYALRAQVEDVESGIRRTVSTSSVYLMPPGTELGDDIHSIATEYGVVVDIDTFTAPAGDHFPSLANFIETNYHSAKQLAFDFLKWMKSMQTRGRK